MSKVETVQQKQSTVDWPGKKGNQKLYLRTKLTKAQTGKQN